MTYPATDAERLRELACEIRCRTGKTAEEALKLAREQMKTDRGKREVANREKSPATPVSSGEEESSCISYS